jgi:hypothetical protein
MRRAALMPSMLLLGGCSHYLLPTSHLAAPEVRGVPYQARIQAGIQGATDLTAAPTLSYPPPESPGPAVPMAQKSFQPTFGFDLGLTPKMDLGVRFEPGSPLRFPLKYQLSGEPEGRMGPTPWAVAVQAAPGILIGSNSGTSTLMISGDLSFPVGYRLTPRSELLAAPFFTFASVSGVQGADGGLAVRSRPGLPVQSRGSLRPH